MKRKTIKVADETWRKLMKWRIDLNCSDIDELLERILKIIPASELKEQIKGGKKK